MKLNRKWRKGNQPANWSWSRGDTNLLSLRVETKLPTTHLHMHVTSAVRYFCCDFSPFLWVTLEAERTALEWTQKHFRLQSPAGSYLTFILQEAGSGAQFFSLMKRPCINQRVVVSLKGMYKENLLWEYPVKRESVPHISAVSAQQRPGEEKKALLSAHADALPQHPGPTLSKDSVLALASSLQAVSPMVCGRLCLPMISESNRRKVSDEGQITTVRRKRGEASKPRYLFSCRGGDILLG